ncbi:MULTISPECIES: dephospho-CoA kinase [unclassified Cytobacillus]|uniref:dephospho-CoA kinase n=1 Tax=unclassified Cytobacillus TaxID=2675268 RepID=UPI00135C1C5E|nr:dephospho-CoA kinase [Cytobacillus sp. AMY 15.2]KAF0819466.1 Dephospho-CoA kinase [Bacillus sp. ZZV12-4809]MCM3092039.1 dephospho-CoA kinase [Cytobacillus sp. AMY 15.2]
MPLTVGLSGGIASGKSTVSSLLIGKGYSVIDADIEARLAVEKGEEAYQEIVRHFGDRVLLKDGSIDRAELGSIIFHDEKERQVLNSIVHPAVRKRMTAKKEQATSRNEQLIILDIPLLFESKLQYMCDKTLLVYADEDVQLKRLMQRNQLSENEAMARIQSQMPLSEKKALADAVIDNNGTIEETEKQLWKILKKWNAV